MTLAKERLFLLDYSLHTSLFEMTVHSLGRERLVGDVSESSGDLDSILCLLGGDKVDSMTNSGGVKLGRMTSRQPLKVRALLRVNPGYSGKGMLRGIGHFLDRLPSRELGNNKTSFIS